MNPYDRTRRSADRSEDAGFPPTHAYPDGYPAMPVGDAGQRRRAVEQAGNPRAYPARVPTSPRGAHTTSNPQFGKVRKG